MQTLHYLSARLAWNLVSAQCKLLFLKQTTFLNFSFLFYTVHSPPNALFLSSTFKKLHSFFRLISKATFCIQSLQIPILQWPSWQFTNMFHVTEVTLFGNTVTCEFTVIILTVTPAMRPEIYWMLIGINKHFSVSQMRELRLWKME